MKINLKKFLAFNGKTVYFLSKEGTYWIAIKPICEALGVNYNRQFQNIKADPILGPACAVQHMQVGQDQLRKWSCLPEFYVYGWIFSIQSDSKELQEYKWKCYELLYNFFHGDITKREHVLAQQSEVLATRADIIKDLRSNNDFLKLEDIDKKLKVIGKSLKELDNKTIEKQFHLFEE